jgi:hypothetical protein
MRTLTLVLAVALITSLLTAEQHSAAAPPYEDSDAYEIYSLLLPDEQYYGSAKGTLVLQQETLASAKLDDNCLTPEAAREFKEATDDYRRHGEPLSLQRRLNIDKPYELVPTDTIRTLINVYNWDEFYKRYPGSGGIIMMSAVGFDRQRTLAIVYTWSACNNQCGSGSFNLFKKTQGKWVRAPGVRCSAAA